MGKPSTAIKKISFTAVGILLLSAGMFVSCRKATPTWDTNILAPVVNASLSIDNLVADSLVQKNPDSSVTLVYNGSLYNMNTDSLVNMPDTTLVYGFGYLGMITMTPGETIFTNSDYTTYGTGSAQLKTATIQSGFVSIEVSSDIKQVTDFTYSVPSATLNSKPLGIYVKVPAKNGSVRGYVKKVYSLAGYTIDFTGPSHNSYNTISTSINGILDSAASSTSTSATYPYDSLVIKVTFYSIKPSYAKGYFGTVTRSYTSQVPFTIFSKVVSGKLDLQDMSVNMVLENYLGVDARVNLAQLTSVNTRTGSNINLTDAGLINNSININRATETHNPTSPVNPSIQTFSITPSNSNILAWADSLPNQVNYAVQITTDPLGNVSGSNDFAYGGYGISSHLDISVPLSLIANNLTLEDTLSVNFSNSTQAQQVKSGTFTLYASNGFPFSAGMQVYLLDSNMKIVDSLMAGPQTIAAGTINGSGVVISPQNSTLIMVLNTERTQRLLKTKHIIIRSRFNMGPPYLKIYSYYQLNVKLVGNFDYQVKG